MAGFHQRISGIEHKKGINENTGRLYKSLSNQDQDIYTLVIFADDDVNQQKSCSDWSITLHFILLEQFRHLCLVEKHTLSPEPANSGLFFLCDTML